MNLPRHIATLFSAIALVAVVADARAEIALSFAVEDVAGEGWSAHGIVIELTEHDPQHLSLAAEVAELVLPDDHGRVEGLRLECAEVAHLDGGWDCAEGRLVAAASPIQAQDATWQASLRPQGASRLEIPKLSIGGGTVALALTSEGGAWSARVTPHRVALLQVGPVARLAGLPTDWGIKGRLSGTLEAGGEGAAARRLKADLLLDQINYASPDGTQAAEKVVLKLGLDAREAAPGWAFDARLGWPQGAVYSDPMYLDAGEGAVDLSAIGHWDPQGAALRLDSWSALLKGIAHVSGTGRLAGADLAVQDLTVAAQSEDAGRLYQKLLQPFLLGSAADEMDVSGQVGLVLHLDAQGLEQAGLQLNQLALSDRKGRFGLGRSTGAAAWDRGAEGSVSRLQIDDAALLGIPTGAFAIEARFAGDRIELVRPIVVPVLGGEVALDAFTLSGALAEDSAVTWQASASLRDVSLEQLTTTLAWPPFGGKIAGQLRDMHYADRVFAIGGGLKMNAFEGDVRVDGLRIEDPFGPAPLLRADAQLRGLSLEALTNTFAFGRIEGRLDGELKGLELTAWQPSRFDLRLYTPPKDDSRRRISQRAVENLTELGSGIPAGLSTTVLQVFDEFRYDRIDLHVSLNGDVAQLDGLAGPQGGYYLVKGAGLPRIDVIGRNRSVAWKTLVERLQQIQVEGARIE